MFKIKKFVQYNYLALRNRKIKFNLFPFYNLTNAKKKFIETLIKYYESGKIITVTKNEFLNKLMRIDESYRGKKYLCESKKILSELSRNHTPLTIYSK